MLNRLMCSAGCSEPALGRLYADLGLGYDAPNTVDMDDGNFAGEHGEGRHTFGLAVPRHPAKAKPQNVGRQTGRAASKTSVWCTPFAGLSLCWPFVWCQTFFLPDDTI